MRGKKHFTSKQNQIPNQQTRNGGDQKCGNNEVSEGKMDKTKLKF